jgi:hypothetical protein
MSVWHSQLIYPYKLITLNMAKNSKNPIAILKKGLDTLKQQVQTCKASLEARLHRNEVLTNANESWLDNDGNTIEEQCVVEALEVASDYEQEFGRLDEEKKKIVQQLCELAGDLNKPVGNKRKHMYNFFLSKI